jgi:excisionase family DNA binding protein
MGKKSGALDAAHKALARIEAEQLEKRLADLAESLSRKTSSDRAAIEKKLAAMTDALVKERKSESDDDRLSTKEVAAMLRKHTKTIERWARDEGLPCKRHGRNLIFRRGDVLRWQAQQER